MTFKMKSVILCVCVFYLGVCAFAYVYVCVCLLAHVHLCRAMGKKTTTTMMQHSITMWSSSLFIRQIVQQVDHQHQPLPVVWCTK